MRWFDCGLRHNQCFQIKSTTAKVDRAWFMSCEATDADGESTHASQWNAIFCSLLRKYFLFCRYTCLQAPIECLVPSSCVEDLRRYISLTCCHGRQKRGVMPPLDLNNSAEKAIFVVSSEKKQISPPFPTLKRFLKTPLVPPPLEKKLFRRPCIDARKEEMRQLH